MTQRDQRQYRWSEARPLGLYINDVELYDGVPVLSVADAVAAYLNHVPAPGSELFAHRVAYD